MKNMYNEIKYCKKKYGYAPRTRRKEGSDETRKETAMEKHMTEKKNSEEVADEKNEIQQRSNENNEEGVKN